MKYDLATRRSFFRVAGGAVLAGGALAGCSTAQQTAIDTALTNFATGWSNFVDQVNAFLAKGCGNLPAFTATANTIETIVGAFYPSAAAAVSAGAAAIQAVASAICSTVPSAPATLSARLKAAATTGLSTYVGNVTINGKVYPVRGYGVSAQ